MGVILVRKDNINPIQVGKHVKFVEKSQGTGTDQVHQIQELATLDVSKFHQDRTSHLRAIKRNAKKDTCVVVKIMAGNHVHQDLTPSTMALWHA